MADIKISQLPVAGTITGAEFIPVVQDGVTKKVPAANLVASAAGSNVVVSNIADAARNFTLADKGLWLRSLNGPGITYTIKNEPNGALVFDTGTVLTGIQASAGKVRFVAEAGVTLTLPDGALPNTRANGSAWALIRIAQNSWDLMGDLELL